MDEASGSPRNWGRINAVDLLDDLVARSADRLGGYGHLDPDILGDVIASADAAFSARIGVTLIAPLKVFASTRPRIELGPGLEISRMTPAEMQHCLRTGTIQPHPTDWTTQTGSVVEFFAVKVCYDEPRLRGEDNLARGRAEADRRFHSAISLIRRTTAALRLLKPGRVVVAEPREFSQVWGLYEPLDTPPLDDNYAPGEWYSLTDAEIADLSVLWTELQTSGVQSSRKIETALHRFSEANTRAELADRFVDFVIAAEALFGTDAPEVSYRFALWGAYRIAKDAHDRRRIFDQLRAIYAVRSDIVHGNEIDWPKKSGGGRYNIDDLTVLTEEHVRRGLRNCIAIVAGGGRFDDWDRLLVGPKDE